MTKKGVSEPRIELMPLDRLRKAGRNPKDHDIGAIVQSIKRFGFAEPIFLDDRTGKIVAGHGRAEALAAMRKDGQAEPNGISPGWMVPVVRGWQSKTDRDAEAYLLASNRLVELGGWDAAGLEEILKDLAKEHELDGSGFDVGDIASAPADGDRAGGQTCPSCGSRLG